jgi:hypothetical protein
MAAVEWARRQSVRSVALGSASAGACLAGSAALRAREHRNAGLPAPARLSHSILPDAPEELSACLESLPSSMHLDPQTSRAINENYIGGL